MGERRKVLPETERRVWSEATAALLLALPELADVAGRTVAGYVAIRGELNPAAALSGLATRGASVALPRVSATTPRLRFHRVTPGAELAPGRFGIPEPDPAGPEVAVGDLDVVILPGVAFDGEGRRLGTGGGYYDALFGGTRLDRGPALIGVAYDFQIVERCPADANDVPVDVVVTEARVIRVGGRS